MSPLPLSQETKNLPESATIERPGDQQKMIEPKIAPEKIPSAEKPAPAPAATPGAVSRKQPEKPPAIDLELKAVRDVMQENIKELFLAMTPGQQKQFKEEGVRTAKEISGLLHQVKVNTKRILDLIKRWLSRLPGINKYFLEQESKIKLDRLLEIKKERAGQGAERIME
ncbi:MAG: hypothetical protein ACOZBH_00080 [Patescibacteria group bacterium]